MVTRVGILSGGVRRICRLKGNTHSITKKYECCIGCGDCFEGVLRIYPT